MGCEVAPTTVAEVLLCLGVIGERVTGAGCGATVATLGPAEWKVLLRPGWGLPRLLCPACLPALPRLLRERAG